MLDKNKRKEQNKKMRNFWCINPATRIKESRKKYNRKKEKGRKRKYEEF